LIAAYNEANRGTWNDKELEEYLKAGMKRGDEINALEFATEKGIEKGIEQGIELGKHEEKTEVILLGNKNGFTITQLSLLTNLTEDEVLSILEKNI
jgi:predicted transposase/invertase (TIGR01784 family)